ncbi:MAG: radical SAM protein [Ignavibacteriae bacterium]|nr:radical SAM protein [Ignavibacteriota bacterium]
MNVRAWLNTISTTSQTLPIVILYVTEGCNLKCSMCFYRNPLPNELTLSEIETLARSLHDYGLRHIVYSGGEPLMRCDFSLICKAFGRYRVKQTLLTNGLLLEKRLADICSYLSEVIVSLDGPTADVHNAIRGVDSFDCIVQGIRQAVSLLGNNKVSIRCVVQKQNFRELGTIVDLARSLGVQRISFLAVDVLSDSFGRTGSEAITPDRMSMLDEQEADEFSDMVEQLIADHTADFESSFISESPAKLRHLVQYFKALNGKCDFPRNVCNAPMVSAVITSTGDVQPCFFLPGFGNIHEKRLDELMKLPEAQFTREQVKHYSLERCKTCVCTLNIQPTQALLNKF